MELTKTLQKILADTEATLDRMTGESPESRAAAKAKFKKFIESFTGKDKDENDATTTDEKK